MEQYRSGHNGHDWKSCVPQKGTEGSNPSCSARNKTHPFGWVLLFPTGKHKNKKNPRHEDSFCFLVRKLTLIKLTVEAIFLQKFIMCTLFYDLSIPHDENEIGFLNSR